jgi:hypothetical protein
MINMLNQTTGLPRQTKTKLLSILAVSALVLAATFLRANSGEDQSEHNGLAGTWISSDPGSAILTSYMSDGRLISNLPITLLDGNGPGGTSELVGTEHGEWIRTGNHQFASTSFSILSSPAVAFTHLVKLTGILKLNETGDELTLSGGTVSVFFPDGTLQFSFQGGPTHFKRVVVGK